MKLHKRLTKNRVIKKGITYALTRFIRFVFRTNRWTILGEEHLYPFVHEGRQAIFVFWHGRLMMMPNFTPKNPRVHVMISVHGDGEVIANCMEYFDVSLVRGSSRKGGANALRGARKILQENKESVSITPDGPKGPRMRINSQVMALARMTGVPVVPATYSVSRAKILKSWDRFLLALPFGKAVLICGEPLSIPPDADDSMLEASKIALENTLNRITLEADEFVGIVPVTPAKKVE